MDIISFFFSFMAGVLSTLSPCVLPILPIIITSSLQYKTKGLLLLILGLAISFAFTGTFITYATMLFDFDITYIKNISAVLLLIFGLIIVVDKFNEEFVFLMSKLTAKGNEKIASYEANSARSQFILGLLLGFVWTPCVGATLGTAISFAIQGESLFIAFLIMLVFSIGAALPLLIIGFFSNKIIGKYNLNKNANKIKKVLGYILILLSVMILTGYDKELETFLVELMPEWLSDLTTSF
jgi:cytochrome c-type biogenesis protein